MDSIFITGVTGQVGSWLAEMALDKGWKVYGLYRRTATGPHLLDFADHKNFQSLEGDLTDPTRMASYITALKPNVVVNLAAQSHVGYSFKNPRLTSDVNYFGVLNLLEAIRVGSPHTRFIQASTSEMFGGVTGGPYNELSKFHPRSPYGVAKLAAHWLTINFREAYGIWACCAIMFNQESERRGHNFVTRKATRSAAEIKLGLKPNVGFGNIDTFRDWSYSPDFCEGIFLMAKHARPEEFVFSSGKTHCIRDMLKETFNYAELGDYRKYVYKDEQFYRPSEVEVLLGDSSKARKVLGWEPKTEFKEMIHKMYDNDYSELSKEFSKYV